MSKILISVIVLFFLSTLAFSAQVELNWDSNPDASGYKIFQATESGVYDYDSPAWNGTGESTIITNLENSKTYYFVIRAYNSCGNESADSFEISHSTEAVCGSVIQVTGGSANSIFILK